MILWGPQMMIHLRTSAQYRWVFACLGWICTPFGSFILTCATQQVPSPWRPQMEDMTNMQLFFSFYSSTSPPLSSMALECLVSCCTDCASVRSPTGSRVALPNAYACYREQMGHMLTHWSSGAICICAAFLVHHRGGAKQVPCSTGGRHPRHPKAAEGLV